MPMEEGRRTKAAIHHPSTAKPSPQDTEPEIMPFAIQEKPEGLIFKIRVQPRSSKNQIIGLYGDALKINLTAPPVDNAGNKACAVFLAGLLSVAKSSVCNVSGHTGRNKQVMVQCPPSSDARKTLRKTIMAWTKS